MRGTSHNRPTIPLARWVGATGIALALAAAPVAGQSAVDSAATAWVLRSAPHVDLWYHGLAVVGFEQASGLPLHSLDYVAAVRAAKTERGIYPTPLDELARELQKEFDKDPAFQLLHFLPLYFPDATRAEMHAALHAVANRETGALAQAGRSTRTGIRIAAGAFESGNHRKRLRQFVEALDREWEIFFSQYRQQRALSDSTRLARLQRRWDAEVAPALEEFLIRHKLTKGRIFVTPALGPEGRLVPGSTVRRTTPELAVWAPPWSDLDASLFSAVREMCYTFVDDALRGEVPRNELQELQGPAAVRCGALALDRNAPALATEYERTFLRAVGEDDSGDSAVVRAAFADAFELEEMLLEILEGQAAAPGTVAARSRPTPRWVIKPQTQADLWFHSLAVVQADQPGPLALYSADYASRIRAVKQELGVYPTLLDSLAPKLREDIASDSTLDFVHFIPLYFPRATPERLLETLRAAIDRRTDRPGAVGPDTRLGVLVLNQAMQRRNARRLLESLADAVEREWEVFYRDYAERLQSEQQSRYAAIQSMWDSLFVPKLGPYLESRRLNAGLVFPSAALGPEGRIIDVDNFNAGDQVVAVQLPLTGDNPAPSVFAFLKELCFLLIDDRDLQPYAEGRADLDDLRRRAAVRCGHMLLELHAPILVGSYRRVFLDAVGAEESSTVSAFERVYPLSAPVQELLRRQIRRQ